MSDLRDLIDRLSSKIPGYAGYADRETRRDFDKRHRDKLADRLRSLKSPINEVVRDLTASGRLFEVGPLDSALKKLDRIENRVRFASYGYAGFFDAVRIEQPQLDAVYQFDLVLVERLEGLEAGIAELKTQAGTADGLKAAVAAVNAELDSFDRHFDKRHEAINGFSPEQAPGRPLFGS